MGAVRNNAHGIHPCSLESITEPHAGAGLGKAREANGKTKRFD